MIIAPPPGLMMDMPNVTPKPFWSYGYNIRWRLGLLETLGLFGPVRDGAGAQLQLPAGDVWREAFVTPRSNQGQVLFGSASSLQVMHYDPSSTPATGTRWQLSDITPNPFAPAVDVVAQPSAGGVEIPPVWWFSDQDDVVVGQRAGLVGEPCYAWGRDPAAIAVPLAGSPTDAVGGGILNRILILLGCTSFSDPDPQRFMTIRWSDRYNFEEWTPSDITISGELQLEGGSRIVGGGVTGFGVIAWTDKRMALLTETGDINSVFARRYIDGSRGLLANRSWTEADGQVWWFDESRVLNVFDGGRPRQIQNPLKYASLERLNDAQIARAYLVANQEFGEIILHFPGAGSDECDNQLVYNYGEDKWSLWLLDRTGWGSRVGPIRNTGVSLDGRIWFHDLDTGIPDDYLQGPPLQPGVNIPGLPGGITGVPAVDVEPYSFLFGTSLMTMDDVTSSTWRMTRLLANYIPLPSDGADDAFTVQVTGYGEAQVQNTTLMQDARLFSQGQTTADFRVSGKALQLAVYAIDVKTSYRFSNFSTTEARDGQR